MPGRLERGQADAAELHAIVIVQRRERILRLGRCAEIDRGAGPLAQFQVPGHEIRVEMRQEDVRDAQPVLLGVGEVLADVALRVDHRGSRRRRVADDV